MVVVLSPPLASFLRNRAPSQKISMRSIDTGTDPAPAYFVFPDGGVTLPVFERLGLIVRALHDALGEISSPDVLVDAAADCPSARERLLHIAILTATLLLLAPIASAALTDQLIDLAKPNRTALCYLLSSDPATTPAPDTGVILFAGD